MDLLIEELCVNNDPPSNEIVQVVKNLLVKPLHELKNLDVEILALEQRIQELKLRRNDTAKWISRHQSILSPIRNLPQEVLGEIFQHCLPSRTNPTIKGTESPLLLTRVCKLWKSVALSEPRLWSRIHVAFMDLDHMYYPSKSQDHLVLHKRLDAMKQWIPRSGTRPLSVSIHFHDARDGPQYSPTTMELLHFLSQLSPRLQNLEVALPLELFRQLENMIDLSQMTNLTSFRISRMAFPTRLADSHELEPLSLLKAPNLRRVSTFNCDSNVWGIFDPSYTSVWSKMTDLSCHMWFSEDEAVSLLARTPNLVHLSVIIIDHRNHEDFSISHHGPISLPFLRTLFLQDNMTSRTRGDLYQRIDAPGLKWIMFTSNTTENIAPRPIPIISLLTRATSLEKLTVCPPSMEAWNMRNAFRAVPSITHLFIGNESKTDFGTAQRMQRGPNHKKSLRFSFQLLLPGNDPPLLPNLQSFEIDGPFIVIDDESLLRFIKSRMAPPAGSGISALKHVASGFSRTQGRDLVEDVRRHAELLGVEMIDLVLGFEKPPTERTRIPGPESGLMQPEVPTGHQANVDNYIRFRSLDSDLEIPRA